MQGSFEERLAAYLGKQIREDTTAVYGMHSSTRRHLALCTPDVLHDMLFEVNSILHIHCVLPYR